MDATEVVCGGGGDEDGVPTSVRDGPLTSTKAPVEVIAHLKDQQ